MTEGGRSETDDSGLSLAVTRTVAAWLRIAVV